MPGEHENTRAGGGWVEARICINTIRQGHIQDISEADAKAEGIIWRVVERARGC
jgi:hypothetical protein